MLLLDTCILVWLDSEPGKISEAAREAIRLHPTGLFYSPASALEVALKVRKGKLGLPVPVEEWFAAMARRHVLRQLRMDWRIAVRSAALPPIHSDPFDRIIIATAQGTGLRIVTPDALIRAYPQVETIW